MSWTSDFIVNTKDGYITDGGYITQSSNYIRAGVKQDEQNPENEIIYRGFLYFDTSILGEGAKAEDVKLWIKVNQTVWEKTHYNKKSNFAIYLGKIDEDTQEQYPHSILVKKDYNLDNYILVNGITETDDEIEVGWNSFSFNSEGKKWIQNTGETKFIFVHTKEQEEKGFIEFFSGNYSEIDCAYLEITYRLMRGYTKRVWVRPDGCKKGDLFYYDGTKLVRLEIGTQGQRLKMGNDGIPGWE